MQLGRESPTVSLLRDQVRRLQEQLEFIKDSKEFHDPDSPSSSGSTHVPHQHRIASSSKVKSSREPGLPRDTREDTSIPGTSLIAILPDKILTYYTMTQGTARPHRE